MQVARCVFDDKKLVARLVSSEGIIQLEFTYDEHQDILEMVERWATELQQKSQQTLKEATK